MADHQMATGDTFMLADDENESQDKHLLFQLGDEEYGVPIDRVQTIEEMHKIVAVPDMPEYVRGVINLRGSVIPVVELRRRFGMPTREFDDRTCIIVIASGSRTVGFIVDTVNEVHEIPGENIQPRPKFNSGDETDQFVTGLGTVDGEVKILLAVDRLMRADEVPETALELGGAKPPVEEADPAEPVRST
ncbi:MAG: chemotaxis protein CheW [Spirochaetota bacterium]